MILLAHKLLIGVKQLAEPIEAGVHYVGIVAAKGKNKGRVLRNGLQMLVPITNVGLFTKPCQRDA